jgi:hypothetical protein
MTIKTSFWKSHTKIYSFRTVIIVSQISGISLEMNAPMYVCVCTYVRAHVCMHVCMSEQLLPLRLKADWPDVPEQPAGYVNAYLCPRSVFCRRIDGEKYPDLFIPDLVHWTQCQWKRTLTVSYIWHQKWHICGAFLCKPSKSSRDCRFLCQLSSASPGYTT